MSYLFEGIAVNIFIVSFNFIVLRIVYYNLKYNVKNFNEAIFSDDIDLIGGFDETVNLYLNILDSSIVNSFLFMFWSVSLFFYLFIYENYFVSIALFIISLYAYKYFRTALKKRTDFINSVKLICDT
ncbi:MAG: hypothetical protein ACOC56_04925, partial [Atribacterota bacterium]